MDACECTGLLSCQPCPVRPCTKASTACPLTACPTNCTPTQCPPVARGIMGIPTTCPSSRAHTLPCISSLPSPTCGKWHHGYTHMSRLLAPTREEPTAQPLRYTCSSKAHTAQQARAHLNQVRAIRIHQDSECIGWGCHIITAAFRITVAARLYQVYLQQQCTHSGSAAGNSRSSIRCSPCG